MEKTRKAQWEKFSLAFWAFHSALDEYNYVSEAFDSDDVKMLFELACSAYLEWKNHVEEE